MNMDTPVSPPIMIHDQVIVAAINKQLRLKNFPVGTRVTAKINCDWSNPDADVETVFFVGDQHILTEIRKVDMTNPTSYSFPQIIIIPD